MDVWVYTERKEEKYRAYRITVSLVIKRGRLRYTLNTKTW